MRLAAFNATRLHACLTAYQKQSFTFKGASNAARSAVINARLPHPTIIACQNHDLLQRNFNYVKNSADVCFISDAASSYRGSQFVRLHAA
jgi:hypothetical protein